MTYRNRTCHLKGKPASSGIGIGHAWLLDEKKVAVRPEKIDDSEIEAHLEKFERAVKYLSDEYRELKDIAEEDASKIIEAQIQILNDPELHKSIRQKIELSKHGVVYAIFSTFNEYLLIIEAADSGWMSDRKVDLVSIRDQLIETAREKKREVNVSDGAVVFATEIPPTLMIKLSRVNIAGIVMQKGGMTSHAVILSQSLGIPCVIGAKWRHLNIDAEADTLLDGATGEIVIWPGRDEVERFQKKKREYLIQIENQLGIAAKPQKTECGSEFSLRANVEFLEELPRIATHGAKGVGLLRTETILFQKKEFDVDDQISFYTEVMKASGDESVTIRLFDAGGDKLLDEVEEDANPFLGWRGIRMLLDKKELLSRQIEAIYRLSGSYPGRVKMLIPMISTIDEIEKVKSICNEIQTTLKESNTPVDENISIGIMVEVPSIALMAGEAGAHVDFFSIGTNDLTQYTLAVDRGNEKISALFEPFHPAIWKLIQMAKTGADKNGIPVAVCGEMASKPGAAACLLGMGISDLSMTTSAIPSVKSVLCSHSLDQMKQLSEKVQRAKNPADVHMLFDQFCSE
jgi:phosphoenolpyruvate-protein phosphotransferase (PTS system enzyme I)